MARKAITARPQYRSLRSGSPVERSRADLKVYPWNPEIHRVKKLEDYLPRVMAALAAAPASVRHRRVEEAEQERTRAKEHERWCREVAREKRAHRRKTFIEEMATQYARLQQVMALSDFISKEANSHADEPVGRISRVIDKMVAEMRSTFEREGLNEEILKLELFGEGDPV